MALKEINILHRKIRINTCDKHRLKGLSVGEKLSYTFYEGIYQDTSMIFLEPRKGNPTPKECEITSDRIMALLGVPVVFILKPGPTYERQRLTDKGVYFVMSDKYAHLPMLIALEKTSDRKIASALTPVAQYILLYHLQERTLEGLSAKEIAKLVPYSYESTTLGITCMEDLGLCEKVLTGQRTKQIHFKKRGIELWKNAKEFFISPVEQRIYCDALHSEQEFPVCGINALAHYTWLNPDPEKMFMLTNKEYRTLKDSAVLENPNTYDGSIIIEVWKYPAIGLVNENLQWVDRLSLAITLTKDNDPRIEKEVERMINDIEWKD